MNDRVVQTLNWKSWMMAARPRTLTAACIPVIAGTALATANIQWHISLFALLSALCIQIGTNLINDALDFKKGADTSSRIGPQRVTQSGLLTMKQVLSAGMLMFLLALLFGIPLILQGGWPIAILMVVSVLCGYCYTGGPLPLAYHGLGDLFVFLFFGLAGTVAVFYLQTGFVNTSAFLAGTQIGLLATVLIAINNFRDCIGDAKVNKLTLPVRLGSQFARMEISLLIFVPFVLNVLWFLLGKNFAGFLPLLTLPLGLTLVRKIWNTEPSPIYNKYLALSALLHLAFGILLAIGLVMS